MAAKDIYHEACVRALEKDGWIITHDPLIIRYGGTEVLIDIGAEQLLAAEREGKRIAVEVKSFIKPSVIQDLRDAIGQFILYTDALTDSLEDTDRTLYLAIRKDTYDDVFRDEKGQKLIQRKRVRLLVFDDAEEVVVLWTS